MPFSIALLRLPIDPRPRVAPALDTELSQEVGVDFILSQPILRDHRSHPDIRGDIRSA